MGEQELARALLSGRTNEEPNPMLSTIRSPIATAKKAVNAVIDVRRTIVSQPQRSRQVR